MKRTFGRRDSRHVWGSISLALMLLFTLIPVASQAHEPDDTIERLIQFGTPGNDAATSIAFYGHNAFVSGTAGGALPDQDYAQSGDAFVRMYDAAWNERWTRQFGTLYIDTANGIAVDGTGLYVVGFTAGLLDGDEPYGQGDAYLRKYDLDGNLLWTRQFGTDASDEATGVAVGPAGVYVAGSTSGTFQGEMNAGGLSDAFIRAYDSDGNELWTDQFGTSQSDAATAISAIDASIYVAGYVGPGSGQTTSNQAFVRAYSAAGDLEWSQEFGTDSLDSATSVTATLDSVYVAGYTIGAFENQVAAGSFDAFVRRYDRDGNQIWTQQFGTSEWDQATGITSFGTNVIVAGWSEGVLPDQTGFGLRDAFAREFDADGNTLRTWQFGTEIIDTAAGIGADDDTVAVTGNSAVPVIGEGGSANSEAFVAVLVDNRSSAPSVVATHPSANQTGVEMTSSVSIEFSEAMDPASITPDTFSLHDEDGTAIPGGVTYDAATLTATFLPAQELLDSMMYTATIIGGPDGVRSDSGKLLAEDYVWTFTTGDDAAVTYRLWRDDAIPAIPNVNSRYATEVGVRFWSDLPGFINGIYFYKGSALPGPRTISLWTTNGVLLARSADMTRTESGWHYIAFPDPVPIEAGTLYIASYHAPAGDYARDQRYFRYTGVDSGPLHAPAMTSMIGGNGVWRHATQPAFPFWSFSSSNYWVDVSFTSIYGE